MKFMSRKRSAAALAPLVGCLAVFIALPSMAGADVTPSITAAYGSLVPGAHTDYTVTHSYTYTGIPVGGPEASYPGASDDLKRWALDSPAGLVGNPNAVPNSERCTAAQFALADPVGAPSCPAGSIVGDATLTLGADASGGTAAVLSGTIYILQTEPEVPTTLATAITVPAGAESATTCGTAAPTPITTYIKTTSVIGPWTNGDFRLRTKSQEDSKRPLLSADYLGSGLCLNGHVKGIVQHLLGTLPNGNAFLTNPTRCDSWDTYLYGQAHDTNSNAAADPNETGTDDFAKSAVHSATPDCATLPGFNPAASETFSTVKRDTNPIVTFNVVDPNVPGSAVPKKLVSTFPKTLSVDATKLPILCSQAQRDAKSCPATSKIGSVSVETALISVPLTGDVFAVQNPADPATPNLGINVKDSRAGGLDFWLDAQGKLEDSRVITTFDNLPQVGFNKFALTVDAGTTGFLKIRRCPSSAARPEDGPINYQMTSYAGQSSTINNTTTFAECVGINKLEKPPKCVANKLNVHPTYASRNNMSKAELFIDGKRVNTNKKDRFTWKWSVKNIKSGKHNLKVRAFYKSGKKAYKKISWTRC
jgi:hypothetical protein